MKTSLPANMPSLVQHRSSTEYCSVDQLPEEVRDLNGLYVDQVSRRALLTATEAAEWLTRPVTVFLRHDKLCVFAIVCGQQVGMADFVTLSNVRFHVNQAARLQSNAEHGPLPNKRAIHAYLTGKLSYIGDSGQLPEGALWEPVRYVPVEHNAFVRAECESSISECEAARLVPGKHKVWVPRLQLRKDGEQPREFLP